MSLGLVGTAVQKEVIGLNFINPRDFTTDIHSSIDDRPFGGGDGMLMSVDPLKQSIEKAKANRPNTKLVYLSPQGRPFTQEVAKEYKSHGDITLLCGRYAGVDERLIVSYVDEELSLGDFILSGAEIAAMAVIDSVSRLVPGVLGNAESFQKESFENKMLEWPQFTRPREFEGLSVPEVLLSGNHAKIDSWKRALSLLRTLDRRPDLLEGISLPKKEKKAILELWRTMSESEKKSCGLGDLDDKLLEFFS